MHRVQEERDQLIDRKKLESLHQKYINLAKDAEKNEDRVLSEAYYQRAEYYLHVMNEPGNHFPANLADLAVRGHQSTRTNIKDFDLKRTLHKELPDSEVKQPQRSKSSLSTKRSFLRRNRRTHSEQIFQNRNRRIQCIPLEKEQEDNPLTEQLQINYVAESFFGM